MDTKKYFEFNLYIHFKILRLYIHFKNMATNNRGKFKTGEPRSQKVPLRMSETELKMVDNLKRIREKYGGHPSSRTDTIIACIKYATGNMDLAELSDFNKSIKDINTQTEIIN